MKVIAIDKLHDRITSVIKTSIDTENLCGAEVIGLLEIIKLDLYNDITVDEEDEI